MMDIAADTPQGVDPIQSTTFVVSKRLRCSTTSTDPVYKALDADNTSFSQGRLHPLDNEVLLEEILLRLPPKPSSLPQASLVCTLWRSILSDPRFLKRFRKHHHKPPLLGFFVGYTGSKHNFVPVMDTKPDRISAARFCVPKSSRDFLGCRHGLAVFIKWLRETVVWDPLTGQQQRVPFPPGLGNAETDTFWDWHAAVLCVDAEDGHVHGDCFSSTFKLVLTCGGDTQASACLYESKSGAWGNIASTPTTNEIIRIRPSVLIRNALFWLLCEGDILAFDIESQSLDVIEKPVDAHGTEVAYSFQLLRTNDSGLGFASMSNLGIQLWKRSSNSDNVVGWVLQSKVIQLEGLFPKGMPSDHKMAAMVGYDEESNAIILATYIGDFMLQFDSIQFIRISKRNCWSSKLYYPYRNFYTAGNPSSSRANRFIPVTIGRGVGWKLMDQKL
ncbi:uncharacterized protein [Lolium perenne]|uniref:uncharacterized protein isoform X1 n=1 Tax=Lolium perenne TaxID=4522 RepID=UPI0021F56782|nr:uncharacterized protein LOC127334785 isoform X1 [Lolium perenne]XP_051217282.1 uncharacterized protein LOC127334785 isoform X1 [Lolium perenne]